MGPRQYPPLRESRMGMHIRIHISYITDPARTEMATADFAALGLSRCTSYSPALDAYDPLPSCAATVLRRIRHRP